MSQADTSELDSSYMGILIDFWNSMRAGNFTADNITHTTGRPFIEANKKLKKLKDTEIAKAREDEIMELIIASGGYGPNFSYSKDRKGFYVVDKSDVEHRLAELKGEEK